MLFTVNFEISGIKMNQWQIWSRLVRHLKMLGVACEDVEADGLISSGTWLMLSSFTGEQFN